MTQTSQIPETLEQEINRLDVDTLATNRALVRLTKWIIALTIVMICVGLLQIVVMWPKRTYCIDVSSTVQLCEPDLYPYDTNPEDPVYKIDKALNL